MNILLLFNIVIIIDDVFMKSELNTWQPFNNLYNTDAMINDISHDCFYLSITDESKLNEKEYEVHQIIEYCIRTSIKETEVNSNENSISSVVTFDELKKKNVTGNNLMEWSSPIDLIEQYEYFLQMNKSSSNEIFYNCTRPWFGPLCQYKFIVNRPFPKMIEKLNADRWTYVNAIFTCYMHLKCNRGSTYLCLDWREICDGKIDCLDGGEDEKHCLELDLNICEENEYQCRNGMCVNKIFLLDERYSFISPECLDQSDEYLKNSETACNFIPLFKCEDIMSPFPSRFTCGDGNDLLSHMPRKGSVCRNKRDQVLNFLIGWHNNEDTRFPRCFKILICTSLIFSSDQFDEYCKHLCENEKECKIQIMQSCPTAFIAPTIPVWGGHIRLGYFSNQTFNNRVDATPMFICYDQKRCPFLIPTLIVENSTCIHIDALNLSSYFDLYKPFVLCNQFFENTNDTHCSDPTMLRCLGTNKCISKRRIMDGISDCYGNFDESISANSCALNDTDRFHCTSERKCLRRILVGDEDPDCIGREDEFALDGFITDIYELPFSAICDNWIDMLNLTNETDETHCEQWQCVNQYTRCNKVWNCPKGIDEINCSSSFQCSADEHPCLTGKNRTMGCLHMKQADDGIVDCLGATDERSYCRSLYPKDSSKSYRCWNDTKCVQVLDRCEHCDNFDGIDQLCGSYHTEIITYLESARNIWFSFKMSFSHKSSLSFPPIQLPSIVQKHTQHRIMDNMKIDTRIYQYNPHAPLCHQGAEILIGKNERVNCLCSSHYYGNFCQYQNQRVTLTIRIRQENLEKFRVIGIVIRLADHTGLIHSYEQITYIPVINCDAKYNLHLLYQDRPKDMTKNYSVYIDAYNKRNLTYITSWIFPVQFLFMPVNRMSALLTIPTYQNCRLLCSDKYLKSLGNVKIDSCQCHPDRATSISIIKYKCNCSPNSICVGLINNRSICLCSLAKVGPRCYLNSICQMDTCKNKGICVPSDPRHSVANFTCVCPEGFSRDNCETKDVQIDVSFSDVEFSQSLLIHFIKVIKFRLMSEDQAPTRTTMFKKIQFHQKIITIHMALEFHLVFVQLENVYYLIVLQHEHTPSIVISTQISSSQHCPHIRELDKVIADYPILRRVKYYHTVCKNHSHLMCFHDNETFMCLCTQERHANCFHFDFTKNYNCEGYNDCQNGAQCFQDHPHCPSKTMCKCQECFYGDKCQFTTKHSGLSLDSILGYHIYPNLSINQQSAPVKISIILAILILIIGLISGILSNLTFQIESTRVIGCGLYLFCSSITSILIVIFLNIKLWFLILSQMNIITGRSFLWFNCRLIEYLLRFLLAINDWLHACVTVERFLVVFLGVRFNKATSKQYAKRTVWIILLSTAASIVHDPIHRRLIDDSEEERTWCILRITAQLEIYDRFINIFHFLIPFSLNFILAIGIIFLNARQRSALKQEVTFKQQLRKQLNQHKHLILSSILLVVLAVPRLIISFLPNCMKSPKQYALFLAGYFVSFIPPILHFFIFVLTSKVYKKEFDIMIRKKWRAFRLRLNPNYDLSSRN
ncbi:unnamed protein product [Adineta steineri]|uniref:Uncharacterized protein n=1 Tax=Adineta steineri TaxID=433720 RepID=A0A814YI53_9BILA|nr:unnamed protein product [Adineta steineri]CAF1229854.1 unnamed protein product [Adineta steineri]